MTTTTVLHPWHGVNFGELAPRVVNAIIEIPQGSRCKYEIDKASGLLKLDRIIYSSFHYPVNYGFIPQTYGGDKDPLDILVITSLPLVPLTLVPSEDHFSGFTYLLVLNSNRLAWIVTLA